MGKAARLRAERSASVRGSLDQLLEVVKAIGDRFDTSPQCVEAACLLVHAGRLLGYELTVRPVSVLAVDEATGNVAFMGPKITSLISPEDLARAEDRRPAGQDDHGHVVVTCEDPTMLFDPNLRQLGAYGIEAPSLALHIASTHPESGQWTTELGSVSVLYVSDDNNRGLLVDYDAISPVWEQEAADLVRLIRAGATADQIRIALA